MSRDEVLELAGVRSAAATERAERRTAPMPEPAGPRPPVDEHEWILAPEATAVLGCTVGALGNRVNRERVPCTRHDGRRWFRLDLLELIVRAKVASRRRGTRPTVG